MTFFLNTQCIKADIHEDQNIMARYNMNVFGVIGGEGEAE